MSTNDHELLERLDDWLSEHYHQNINAERIAKAMFMDRSNLHRKLKKLCGVCITTYLAKYRIIKAKERYQFEKNLTRLAFDVGFGDYRDFARRCYQLFQCTPSQLFV